VYGCVMCVYVCVRVYVCTQDSEILLTCIAALAHGAITAIKLSLEKCPQHYIKYFSDLSPYTPSHTHTQEKCLPRQ